jgi:hypothetical protein
VRKQGLSELVIRHVNCYCENEAPRVVRSVLSCALSHLRLIEFVACVQAELENFISAITNVPR